MEILEVDYPFPFDRAESLPSLWGMSSRRSRHPRMRGRPC